MANFRSSIFSTINWSNIRSLSGNKSVKNSTSRGSKKVALLVGGVAIANVMVMSVLERRMEIGVRRSIGATRREIRYQFLLESIVLSGIGGLVGVGLGAVIT